jgi:ketosteroid isomerase-like protein
MTARSEIDDLLARWSAAEQSRDGSALGSLLTEDFTAVGPLGFVLPRAAYLGRGTQGLRYEAFQLAEVQPRLYGDSAVVVLRINQKGTAQGNPIPEAARATLTFVRQGGAWRLAAIQHSFVAGTPGAPPLPGPPQAPERPRSR